MTLEEDLAQQIEAVAYLGVLLAEEKDKTKALLAACKAMRRTMYSDKSEESKLADAAIAQAEGKQS